MPQETTPPNPGTTTADPAASAATSQPLETPAPSLRDAITAALGTGGTETPPETTEETPEAPEDETPAETTEETPETSEGETPPETTEETPETSEGETPADTTEETPEEPVQKRINQLVAQKSEAERRAEAAEAQLAEAQARASAPQPTEADPLAHVLTEAQLNAELAEARNAKRWATLHPDGGEVTVPGKDGKPETIELSSEQRHKLLADAETLLEAAPRRAELIRASHAANAELTTIVPDLFKTGSPNQIAVAKMMANVGPHLRAIAAFHHTSAERVAVALLGGDGSIMKALAAAKPNGKTTPSAAPATGKAVVKPKTAPPIPKARTAPSAPARDVAARQALSTDNAGKPQAARNAIRALIAA